MNCATCDVSLEDGSLVVIHAMAGHELELSYQDFLESKAQCSAGSGFAPTWMHDSLFDFQSFAVDWSLRKGRSALFEDCGLGKSRQELVWAENIVRHTNKPVLILTPLAVGKQIVAEAKAVELEAKLSRGKVHKGINVTNYEKLHLFNPSDFGGCVCDE